MCPNNIFATSPTSVNFPVPASIDYYCAPMHAYAQDHHPNHIHDDAPVDHLLRLLDNAPPNIKLLIAIKLKRTLCIERRLKLPVVDDQLQQLEDRHQKFDHDNQTSEAESIICRARERERDLYEEFIWMDDETCDEKLMTERLRWVHKLKNNYKIQQQQLEYVLRVDAIDMKKHENPEDYNASLLCIMLMSAWDLVDSLLFCTTSGSFNWNMGCQVDSRMDFSDFSHDFLPLCCGKKFHLDRP